METQTWHTANEVLTILARTPGSRGDLNNALRYIAKTAQDAFKSDACAIIAFNPITRKFIGSRIVTGDLDESKNSLPDKPRPDGITQQVLNEGILLVEDLHNTPQYYSPFTRNGDFRSFAGIAMRTRHRQRPLGVIYLDFKLPRTFSKTDYEYFRSFAAQAAFLLQETWVENHLEEVALIGQEINHNLATAEDLFQELQLYKNNILDESHTLVLGVYQPQTNTLDLYSKEGDEATFTNIPLRGAFKEVIESQKELFIREMSDEADEIRLQALDAMIGAERKETLIIVPLTLRDLPLGLLSIQHPQPKAYGQEDLFVLKLLANYIALALHNMRLYSSLSQLNETGQILTQQLQTEQTLQATVEKIRDATNSDLVILFPYDPVLHRFILPPRRAGSLLDPTFPKATILRSDDIAALALNLSEPIFAREGIRIYTELLGKVNSGQGNFNDREKIRSVGVVPLRVEEESVGVLFVNFRQPQRFDASQKLLIEGLAHFAAIAIKNSQVFGTLSLRRTLELEALQKIDRELSHILNLTSVLNTILKLAIENIPADESSILLINTHTRKLETVAAVGHYAEASRKQVLSLDDTKGISLWVMKERKSVRVNNVHEDLPWRDLHLPVAPYIVSELDVPLLDGDEAIGVLNFESTKEGAFRQEDQDFLLTLAGQAVLAIKNAQAYEREKRLAEEGQVLNQVSREITSQLDLNHVFDLILRKALELTRSTRGTLMLYEQSQNDLWLASIHGLADEKIGKRQSLDAGIVGYAARNKQLLNVDLSQPPWNDMNLDYFPGTLSELAVPMLVGDELKGVLNVESFEPNNYRERDEHLLQGLADLAVIALQNAEAYERERRLAEEERVLNQVSREITSQLDLNHVFNLILKRALELTRSTLGSLHVYDPDADELSMVAEQGVAEGQKGKRQKLGEGVVGYVGKCRHYVNVKNVMEPPWNSIFIEFFPGARSELAVPMLAGQALHGVLNVESPNSNNFSEGDERLLQGLADLAVIALQNAQAFDREKRLSEERQVLNDISKEITSQLDHVRVFDLILQKTLELTGCSLGALMLYDSNTNDLRFAAARGIGQDKKQLRIPLHQGIIGYVASNKQSVNVPDVSCPPWNKLYLELFPKTRSELAIPMLAGGELRGILNAESTALNHFKSRDERLLQGLADLAVVALQNAEHYQQAEMEAQRFKLLNQAGQELARITDLAQLEQAYDIVLRIAEQESQSVVVIRRFEKETKELEVIRSSLPKYPAMHRRTSLNSGINGQVARERRTIEIRDVKNPPPEADSPQPSDPGTRSLLITPIMFENMYYGNLGLSHREVGHFQHADRLFFEGLAQQLATTIHRLETVQARRDFERRALASEEMSSIGLSAFEVTHRLGNDLGLVESYVTDIHTEMENLGVSSPYINRKLDNVLRDVKRVLSFSIDLKEDLARLRSKEEAAGEPVLLSPKALLEEALAIPLIAPNVSIRLVEVDNDVPDVRVIHNLVADILRNLITNAAQAMPGGGVIELRLRNAGSSVALEVSDTGVGISKDKLSQVFDLFFSTKRSSGFGLWSARRNALKNHGELTVKSTIGQGTTFTLLLPGADSATA